jgi:hypothetical protein
VNPLWPRDTFGSGQAATQAEAHTGDEERGSSHRASRGNARGAKELYQKARQEPAFRIYTLYEAVCRKDVLFGAWLAVRKNDGSPGVDGVSFKHIEGSPEGVGGFLESLRGTSTPSRMTS